MIHVNDIILIEMNETIVQHIKQSLTHLFEMIDLRLVNYYLDMKIERESKSFTLTQSTYFNQMIDRFDSNFILMTRTSMNFSVKLIKSNLEYVTEKEFKKKY